MELVAFFSNQACIDTKGSLKRSSVFFFSLLKLRFYIFLLYVFFPCCSKLGISSCLLCTVHHMVSSLYLTTHLTLSCLCVVKFHSTISVWLKAKKEPLLKIFPSLTSTWQDQYPRIPVSQTRQMERARQSTPLMLLAVSRMQQHRAKFSTSSTSDAVEYTSFLYEQSTIKDEILARVRRSFFW